MADPVDTTETPEETLPAASSTPSVPSQDNATAPAAGTSNDESLKAQLQKIEMERNMLRKKVDAAEKAERERTQKQLEDNEEWRTLAEQSRSELEAFKKEREEAETKATREAATADVFKDYPANVVEVAKTTGLSASSDTEEDKKALKEKLDAIQKSVGSTAPRVQGSNPAPSATPQIDGKRLTQQMHFDDRNIREQAIKSAVGSHPQVRNFAEWAKSQNGVAPQSQ